MTVSVPVFRIYGGTPRLSFRRNYEVFYGGGNIRDTVGGRRYASGLKPQSETDNERQTNKQTHRQTDEQHRRVKPCFATWG